ncbi:hypothetical protein F3Y22_tig00111332pilonHSYRG00019 [Hibiscus syriacus]|uniref:F-box domain-containing protein n=1 Tax=Hibiscus syriacus TaxID=106335 RepID=A0A6A2YPL7_HIBSY|nr:hypothetical protein F3Y22_tig00111332pilonHSYRG00019 [Hibiscus syriacus]
MDRISELPEELLVRILCSLSLKEAARNSVVSRVWRGLWKFITCSLKFEASQTFRPNLKELRKERGCYVEWVTHVLNSHEAPTIDELRVSFDLTQRHSHNIDRWIGIALMKRVKRLELDFTPCRLIHWNDGGHYVFADRFCGSPDIKFLTSLCFKHVEVSGTVLETFLSGCPLLETLHVSHSPSERLTNLNVCGSSLRLKHLLISFCNAIKSIEVHAPNLVSFEYSGDESIALRIGLKYVPKLRDVSYGIPYGAPWDSIKGGLINLMSLVDSSPLLHKFRVELEQGYAIRLKKGSEAIGRLIDEVTTMINDDGKRSKMLNLKVVEIDGFVGAKADIALLVYLFYTALNLDNIVINTCPPQWDCPNLFDVQRMRQEDARMLAYYLILEHRPQGLKCLVL